MKRFVFRLESVLRIRAFELDRARVALAAIEAEKAKRAQRVHRASVQLVDGRALFESEMATGVEGNRLTMRASALSVARLRLEKAESDLAELAKPLAEAQRIVKHRRMRLRSLERLREIAEDEHRRQGLAAEQAELEELAIGRLAIAGNQACRRTGGRIE